MPYYTPPPKQPHIPPSGVWCPAVTFFDRSTDTLDLISQKKYYAYLSTSGLAGLVILGTNAEAFLLTHEERSSLISCARSAVDPNFPLMAGIGAHSTKHFLELAEDAYKAGANYVLALPVRILGKLLRGRLLRISLGRERKRASCRLLFIISQ
jgi:4-hydroxy-2-oxoglutarate aldolase